MAWEIEMWHALEILNCPLKNVKSFQTELFNKLNMILLTPFTDCVFLICCSKIHFREKSLSGDQWIPAYVVLIVLDRTTRSMLRADILWRL